MNERIKYFMKVRHLTASSLADAVGIPKYTIDRYVSGRTAPTTRFTNAFLTAFPDVNPDWLIKGTGEVYKTPQTASNGENAGSPYFDDATIQGGIGAGAGNEVFALQNAAGRLNVPGLPMGDDIIYIKVRGNSMVNHDNTDLSIPAGSWIGIRKCQSSSIRWGEVYAFHTLDGPVVKRLFKSEHGDDYVQCVSYNVQDGYAPYELPKSEIIGSLYDVVAVLRVQTR